MRVTCPACHAEHSLDTLLTRQADALAVAQLLERGLPFGALLLRYIALFRPGKRRLGLERMAALITELLPDIERQAIHRKGRDWPAPQSLWVQAIESVMAARDKGTLTLPMTSHGYLYEVLCAMSDKTEAATERATEEQRRQHRSAVMDTVGPVAAAFLAPAFSQPQAAAASRPLPYDPSAGPSRAAQRIKAQMTARMQAKAPPTGEADA